MFVKTCVIWQVVFGSQDVVLLIADLLLFYRFVRMGREGTTWLDISPRRSVQRKGIIYVYFNLPLYQRKGYGKLLIAFSYELKKKGKSERRRGLCPISG